jgi:hypothetical protein
MMRFLAVLFLLLNGLLVLCGGIGFFLAYPPGGMILMIIGVMIIVATLELI